METLWTGSILAPKRPIAANRCWLGLGALPWPPKDWSATTATTAIPGPDCILAQSPESYVTVCIILYCALFRMCLSVPSMLAYEQHYDETKEKPVCKRVYSYVLTFSSNPIWQDVADSRDWQQVKFQPNPVNHSSKRFLGDEQADANICIIDLCIQMYTEVY